ncbi:SapC family protein [Alsobacter sp. R-9]
MVSISPVEVALLAQRFPVAWRRLPEGWDLVAVTGLTRWHDYHEPATAPDGSLVSPLLLQAYPLTLVDDGSTDDLPVLVDETALAWGSPRLDEEERGVREAEVERRCQALWTYVNSRRALVPIHAALEEAGAFVPWDLTFSRGESHYGIGGLHVLAEGFFGSVTHRRLVAEHGWLAAQVVSIHRIAQHRINAVLRDMAKAS